MTCIAAIRHGGRVTMGADAMVNRYWTADVLAEPKVMKRGGILVGCAGDARILQEMRHEMAFPRCNGQNPVRYMSRTFSKRLRETLNRTGFNRTENAVQTMAENVDMLVALKGRVFLLTDSYTVLERPGEYSAIGSGAEIALGVLYATRESGLAPQERLSTALEAASHHSPFVGPPFTIIDGAA